MITSEYLHSIFDYKDGILYRKKQTGTKTKVGEVVGTLTKQGYTRVGVKSSRYLAHRLIWLMFNNSLPEFIDHIDCNKQNNRIENLRIAEKGNNNRNINWNRKNTSGYKGVSLDKETGKWKAQINCNGKKHSIGRFKTPELAHAAYCKKAVEFFGEFANEGRKQPDILK